MSNPPTPHKGSGKVRLWDWDFINSLSDDECSYCLTEKEVQIILATIEPIGWVRRWTSPTEDTIDLNTITVWSANLARKLMSGCCPDPITNQFYDENGILQVSTDGGITYNPATDDPRMNSPLSPPLTSTPGIDRRCEAANNVVSFIEAQANQLIGESATWGTLTALVAAVLAIVFLLIEVASAGTLTPLLIGLAAALLQAGSAAFEAAMTEEVYDTLLCIVYCNTPDDGNYSVSDWQAIKAQISGELTGIAEKWCYDLINGAGLAGLTNMSRSGFGGTRDCGECDCPTECPAKYNAGIDDEDPYHGEILSTNETQLFVELGDTLGTGFAYFIMHAVDNSNCCHVSTIEVTSGTMTSVYHQDCGTGYNPEGWIPTAGEGCIGFLQIQGTAHAQITITMTECP